MRSLSEGAHARRYRAWSRIRSGARIAAKSGSQAVVGLGGDGEWAVVRRGLAIVQDAAHAGARWQGDLGVGRALAGAKEAKVAIYGSSRK